MIRQASDEGVTEIIGFVLIMGLVAVVLFIMALVVPPMTGAEMEGGADAGCDPADFVGEEGEVCDATGV